MRRLLIVLWLILFLPNQAQAARWFVSFTNGNDASAGTSIETAWKTLAKVSTEDSTGGDMAVSDSLYVERGYTIQGKLLLYQGGTAAAPRVISTYGTGSDPTLRGSTTPTWAVYLDSVYVADLSGVTLIRGALKSVYFGEHPGTEVSSKAVLLAEKQLNTWFFDPATDSLFIYNAGIPSIRPVSYGANEYVIVAADSTVKYVEITNLNVIHGEWADIYHEGTVDTWSDPSESGDYEFGELPVVSRTIYASNNGNDANRGDDSTAPIRTFATANTLSYGYLGTLALDKGSRWREVLIPPDSAMTVTAYGSGAMPIIDGSDPMNVEWTLITPGGSQYTTLIAAKDSTYALWLTGGVLGTRVMTQALLDANLEWRIGAGGVGNPDSIIVHLTTPPTPGVVFRSNRYGIQSTKNSNIYKQLNVIKCSGDKSQLRNIYITGVNNLIEQCFVDSTGLWCIHIDGVGGTVRNTISKTGTSKSGAVGIRFSANNGSAYNNTIPQSVYGVMRTSGKTGFRSFNNIIVASAYGQYLDGSLEGFVGNGNLISGSSVPFKLGTSNYATVAAWSDTSKQDINSIKADPRFYNTSAGDYRSRYPRIGTNLYSSGVTVDYAGRRRPNSGKFSAGAHQLTEGTQMGEVGNEIGGWLNNEVRSW